MRWMAAKCRAPTKMKTGLTALICRCLAGTFTFPLDGNARIARFADCRTPANLWYFLHDGARDGRGYFVGYDSKSKLCVGFIGRDGFRPDQPPVEQWFPMDGVKLASGMALPRNPWLQSPLASVPMTSRASPSFPRGKYT